MYALKKAQISLMVLYKKMLSMMFSEGHTSAPRTVRYKWKANHILSCGPSSLCRRQIITAPSVSVTTVSDSDSYEHNDPVNTLYLLKLWKHVIPKRGKTVYRKLLNTCMNIIDLFMLSLRQNQRIHMTKMPLLYI